jgi:hypothetical protein
VGIVFLGDGNAIFNFKIPTLDKIPFNPQNNNQGSGGDGGTSDTNQTLLKKCGGAVSLNQKSLYGKIGSICSKCISIDTMCNNKYGRFGDYATSIEAKAKEGDTGFYCAVAWLNPKEPASKCD